MPGRRPRSPLTHLDWRDLEGRNWLSAVRDQERCGSCWAFAATAAIEAMYKINNRLADSEIGLRRRVPGYDAYMKAVPRFLPRLRQARVRGSGGDARPG